VSSVYSVVQRKTAVTTEYTEDTEQGGKEKNVTAASYERFASAPHKKIHET